jgi:hypothetical protein
VSLRLKKVQKKLANFIARAELHVSISVRGEGEFSERP